MKAVRKVHPDRNTEDTVQPVRAGPNDYQYYRSYDNKWHISVVCNYAVRGYQEGNFEIAVWCYDQKSPHWAKGVQVIGTSLTFKEVADFIEFFETNPSQAVKDYSIEIESGI